MLSLLLPNTDFSKNPFVSLVFSHKVNPLPAYLEGHHFYTSFPASQNTQEHVHNEKIIRGAFLATTNLITEMSQV